MLTLMQKFYIRSGNDPYTANGLVKNERWLGPTCVHSSFQNPVDLCLHLFYLYSYKGC